MHKGARLCADGWSPLASLVQGSDGSFYGSTGAGGEDAGCGDSSGCGTLFKITPDGILTTLYTFSASYAYAANFVAASDGSVYGTAHTGGSRGGGEVFRITPEGVVSELYSFSSFDNSTPITLLQAQNGDLYGSAYDGGVIAFRLTLAGAFSTVYTFSPPFAPSALVQASSGDFYGVSSGGGSNGSGLAFMLTLQGNFTTLDSFPAGAFPSETRLIQGSDGNFYGTSRPSTAPCIGLCGTVFRLSPTGALTTVHEFFLHKNSGPGQSFYPTNGVVEGADGRLYGTTEFGGDYSCAEGCGTVFALVP